MLSGTRFGVIRLTAIALACGLVLPFHGVALAQELRTQSVTFEPGASSAVIEDEITGRESVLYLLGAEATQRLLLQLEASNPQTFFNVYAPGEGPGGEVLATSQIPGERVPVPNRFDSVLETSGTYSISVYLAFSAASAEETSRFSLAINLEGDVPERVEGDFADGLQGGPDFFEVRTEGDPLNVRARASAGAVIVIQLDNGQRVRNLGCRMAEGRRWCQVATADDPPFRGWAAGDFLFEAGAP